LLELLHAREQRGEATRAAAGAANVRARDVAAVAVATRAGIDEQRRVARDARLAVCDVVQHRGVRAERDDVLVRRRRIVLLRRLEVREVKLELARLAAAKLLLGAAMAAHRAAR